MYKRADISFSEVKTRFTRLFVTDAHYALGSFVKNFAGLDLPKSKQNPQGYYISLRGERKTEPLIGPARWN